MMILLVVKPLEKRFIASGKIDILAMTQTKTERIFLIINKYAGHKNGAKAIEMVIPYLKERGYLVEHSFTKLPRTCYGSCSKSFQSSGFDLVVAVGGDGTVNEVAQGLVGTITPMGIIPMGSGIWTSPRTRNFNGYSQKYHDLD